MPSEWTPLMGSSVHAAAKTQSGLLTTLLGSLQAALLLFFLSGTSYSPEYEPAHYVVFRDIMVMLLLGFGYLMTFLKQYGLGAVGFTLLITVLAMQLNVAVELGMRFVYGSTEDNTAWPMPLSLPTLIDGEFAAATMLISYGAVIGRATPVQLVIMTLLQSVVYAFNKVIVVLGLVGAEDVGGSITIHMFGAYFGLACSWALGPPKSTSNADPSRSSDLLALIGTTLLWVYWPSFVGATETGLPLHESRCVLHTVLALLGSTGATFYLSQKKCHGKMDPVHIANSTLAGGVAVGSSARLAMTPGGALALGVLAGIISVYGYVHASPFLESKGIYDTCGVGNLHGLPSLLGGIGSMVFVAMDPAADFLTYSPASQMARQLVAVVSTVVMALLSGYATGLVMVQGPANVAMDEYEDAIWWEGEYFDVNEE